jgi:GNAT superfamily N-acetyltransferase
MENVTFRQGRKEDIPGVMELVKALAEFESAVDQVEDSIEKMEAEGFGENPVYRVFVAEKDNQLLGFALTYFRYSTWKGKVLFLEDLFVKKEHRGLGIGKKLMEICLHYASQEKLPFLCLQVLDWNQPARDFYRQFGAAEDSEWVNVMIPVRYEAGGNPLKKKS